MLKDRKSKILSDAEAKILLGVHNYCNEPASRPSKLDIHLLSYVYYQVHIYLIAGNFRGKKLSRMVGNEKFAEKSFMDS